MTAIDENTSDGFHTFKELYQHRQALTMALFRALLNDSGAGLAWRSLLHHDGEVPFGGGWFIVGVELKGYGTITYHYEDKYWSDFNIPGVLTLERAPEWDGADADEVVMRLAKWSLR